MDLNSNLATNVESEQQLGDKVEQSFKAIRKPSFMKKDAPVVVEEKKVELPPWNRKSTRQSKKPTLGKRRMLLL